MRSGFCSRTRAEFALFSKRLDRGTFRLPPVHEAGATSLAIDEQALDDLLDGIDIETENEDASTSAARVH